MIKFTQPTVEQFFRTYTITNFAVNSDEMKLVFNTAVNSWGAKRKVLLQSFK